MRYYRIEITNAQTGAPILGADGTKFGPYTSFVNGLNIPGALNIEFDIPVYTFDQPISPAYLKIWGIGLTTIGQASQFNPNADFTSYCNIKIFGGMQKGLPLANPLQSGLLLDGTIQQAFGNWQGTLQTLDFVIISNAGETGSYGSAEHPLNFSFNWMQNQQLGAAVALTLQSAFPKAAITGADDLNSFLALPYDPQAGAWQTLGQFASYVSDTSQTIVGGSYQGVKIVPTQNGFRLFDGTKPTDPLQIQFTDLIGQPTWLGINQISFKTVLRADIAVGDYIRMPQGPQVTTAASFSQYRQRATFQGTFQVQSVRHMGNFRQKSGDAWVTVIEAYTPPPAS